MIKYPFLLICFFLVSCADSERFSPSEVTLPEPSLPGIVGAEKHSPLDKGLKATVHLQIGFYGLCTGTLIDTDVVLTAAHCIPQDGDVMVSFAAKSDENYLVPRKAIKVHDGYRLNKVGVQKIKVYHTDDLALLLLDRSAPEEAFVAALPSKPLSLGRHAVRAFGYGKTGYEENDSDILRMVNLNGSVKLEDQTKIFFDQKSGKGICQGDSGGPIFKYQQFGGPQVVALVNGADDVDAFLGEPVGDLCRYTGVATQTAYYLDWIKDSVQLLRQTN